MVGFFNSVMQCLNATTELTIFYLNDENFKSSELFENLPIKNQEPEILKANKKPEIMKINFKNNIISTNEKNFFKKPLKPAVKPSLMNINETFKRFLKGAREANPKLYDPSELYNKMGSLYSQFRGHSQQDAQEFLRFFLGIFLDFILII